jgi:hypothetical protein
MLIGNHVSENKEQTFFWIFVNGESWRAEIPIKIDRRSFPWNPGA